MRFSALACSDAGESARRQAGVGGGWGAHGPRGLRHAPHAAPRGPAEHGVAGGGQSSRILFRAAHLLRLPCPLVSAGPPFEPTEGRAGRTVTHGARALARRHRRPCPPSPPRRHRSKGACQTRGPGLPAGGRGAQRSPFSSSLLTSLSLQSHSREHVHEPQFLLSNTKTKRKTYSTQFLCCPTQ